MRTLNKFKMRSTGQPYVMPLSLSTHTKSVLCSPPIFVVLFER